MGCGCWVHALRGICFGNVGREMEWLVRRGEFDRMLVRPMSPPAIASLVVAVLGGCLVEAALELALASLTFRIVRAHALFALVNDIKNRFGSYPLHIFGDLARFVLTFGVPVAFIAYLPATVLLGRTGEAQRPPSTGLRCAARWCGNVRRSLSLLAKPTSALPELGSLTRSDDRADQEVDDVA